MGRFGVKESRGCGDAAAVPLPRRRVRWRCRVAVSQCAPRALFSARVSSRPSSVSTVKGSLSELINLAGCAQAADGRSLGQPGREIVRRFPRPARLYIGAPVSHKPDGDSMVGTRFPRSCRARHYLSTPGHALTRQRVCPDEPTVPMCIQFFFFSVYSLRACAMQFVTDRGVGNENCN